MECTLYDPTLDPDGEGAELIADMLVALFAQHG